ncbi:hypothetical protein BGZ91_004712 [Linnemannia elongata]|nr:hypothetical protein BGZ91_004712 [Linnemannia elongata]KAG0077472.1 hypothetical protein BGZ90_007111 [Linnemannia elongata]
MAHLHNDNNNSNSNIDGDLINTGNESTNIDSSTHVDTEAEVQTPEHSGDTVASETILTSPIAIVASPTSASTTTEEAGPTVGGNVVSFSPLPAGRSLAESYPTRRLHEFGSSPARSLVHVLETAGAAGSQDDQWVANASVATTGTSGVHFQPQRGAPFSHQQYRRAGSGSGSNGWMATSMPESRFSEFEVVYDDGVRKQRTFSLTTELDEERSKPAHYLGRAFTQTIWSYISGDAIPLPTKRILKASLAYFFACLLSFTPFFLPFIGMSGHLAATSAVFFNPAKTLGRMVDAVTAGLCAITFGVLVSVASMLSAIWFNSRDLYIWGHVVSVIVFGGGSTFIIAYAKACFNRPTVNVGKFRPIFYWNYKD